MLRPPIAQERLEQLPDGLVRILLKKAYSDGTVAVEMDPLSLPCRLAASVPPPRLHTVRYAGALAAGSQWRSRITPESPEASVCEDEADRTWPVGAYRRWGELLRRSFGVDVLCCSSCGGRMRLLAVIKEEARIVRYLAAVGEATEVPGRTPSRGPPYWRSQVLRRKALGDWGSGGVGGDEVA